jgi:hypothetical protein
MLTLIKDIIKIFRTLLHNRYLLNRNKNWTDQFPRKKGYHFGYKYVEIPLVLGTDQSIQFGHDILFILVVTIVYPKSS